MKKLNLLLIFLLASILFLSFACGDDDDDDDSSSTDDDNDDSTDDDDDDNDTSDDDDDDDDDDDNDAADPLDLVNVFVGTGGFAFGAASLHPGPQAPNGMIRPCPDTGYGIDLLRFQHFCGYGYGDDMIRGFSNTRLVGTGAIDQGNIRMMPVMGIDDQKVKETGYRSKFSKENEQASVGYYRVLLDRYNVTAELAAGYRVAFHKYTWNDKADAPYVIIDAGASIENDRVEDAEITVDMENNEIYGFTDIHGSLSGRYGGLPTYFVIQFTESIDDYGTFDSGVRTPQGTNAQGPKVGAYVSFDLEGKQSTVMAKVAISYISVDQARANAEAELTDWDFDGAVDGLRDEWSEKLELVDIKGGTELQRRIFYTALYHAYMMPTLFTEDGGKYVGFDNAEHTVDGYTYYTDMSLWDTFRTLHPLMTLVDPDRSRDFVISLVKMYEQGGYLPRWPQGKGYTGCMIGTHADSVITEAYIKGITDFDAETAYDGMYLHGTQSVSEAGRAGMDNYTTIGYVAYEDHTRGASHTVEYAYDDYCIGVLAQELGYTDDAAMFLERGGNYANVFDTDTQFIRARHEDGTWKTPFFPLWAGGDMYVEGSAWHWTWFVPHDVLGYIDLFGGVDPFVEKLNTFFEKASEQRDHPLPDLYYWHGNEPDIHSVYMFNEAGRPDLTQKYARWIMKTKYHNQPYGLDGNDDGGTLSSWYVFSSLGFFPLNPCDGRYMIGSPLFDEATVHLPGGDLVITVENNSEANMYVQSVKVNGEELTVPWFDHSDIANGGTLEFVMGPEPAK